MNIREGLSNLFAPPNAAEVRRRKAEGILHGLWKPRKVIRDADGNIIAWQGDQFLEPGFVYAPYIPMFRTPTLVTADLVAQRGF